MSNGFVSKNFCFLQFETQKNKTKKVLPDECQTLFLVVKNKKIRKNTKTSVKNVCTHEKKKNKYHFIFLKKITTKKKRYFFEKEKKTFCMNQFFRVKLSQMFMNHLRKEVFWASACGAGGLRPPDPPWRCLKF